MIVGGFYILSQKPRRMQQVRLRNDLRQGSSDDHLAARLAAFRAKIDKVIGLAHLYNLIPSQRRALHAGLCGVEVEGGRLPTSDWMLNLQILTS